MKKAALGGRKKVSRMNAIIVTGADVKEIAALVFALQEQQKNENLSDFADQIVAQINQSESARLFQ